MVIYLDPGTGSMVIQFTVGAITGLLVAARLFRRSLSALVQRGRRALSTSSQHSPERNIQNASTAEKSLEEITK